MSDSKPPGEHVAKTGEKDRAERHPPPARNPNSSGDTHITTGNVLWTLTRQESTAQARRWITEHGFELEMRIWTGPLVEGEEDLSWSQLFATEEALAETALAKRRQLESAGWVADIDTAPL
jgi:hypothetical protein